MPQVSVRTPYPIFTDVDGSPLKNGFIYVGQVGLDPETNPVNLYWDDALTIPAAQPVRTMNGYPSRNGSPGRLHVEATDYSITTKSKNGSLVNTSLNSSSSDTLDSGDVEFLQDGTGAIYRTVEDRLRERISVKEFDAKGDGATDDTAAIQAALTAAASRSVGVFFPPGVYSISSTLSLSSASGVTMHGSNATIKQTGGRLTNTLHILDSSDVTVRDLKFQGTNDPLLEGDSGFAGQGIYVTNSDTIRILNNEIFEQSGSGVLCWATNNVWIDKNNVHDNLYLWDIAFGYASPPDNTPLENVWITDNKCHSPNGAWGVHVQGYGRNVNITGNHTKGHNDYGILVYRRDDFASRQWSDVVVSNNLVEDVTDSQFSGYFAGMGIYLQTITNITVTGNIVRNVLQGRTDADSPNRILPPGAISLNGTSEVTCTGNSIEDSGIDGIDAVNVSDGTKGNTISGNSISNCYQSGIYVSATSKLTVANNTLDGTADDNGAGISVSDHPTTTEDIIINNNVVTQGFFNGITVSQGTGDGCNRVTITDNIIRDVPSHYISCTNSGQIVISGNSLHQTAIAHTAGSYAILCSSVDDVLVEGNFIKGGASEFARGLAVVNSASPLVMSNLIQGISDIFYALYMAGNTDQHLYGNVNPRQGLPMFGPHGVGNDPSNDTQYLITYGTSIPTTGSQGSIHWNLAPVAGGTVGWVCVAPNTWKPFGNIDP